jgi:soluble lytic murein transglycosylase-like protein
LRESKDNSRKWLHPRVSSMKFWCQFAISTAVLALAAVSAGSTELAILRNGFTIRHAQREARGAVTRLYLNENADDFVDIPTEEIVGYEKLESPPPPVSSTAPAVTLEEVISAASSRNHLDPDLVVSLIHAESGFNAGAVSPKGAKGLMQLMPRTAAQLGVKNSMDPTANVEGGTRYLKELLDMYRNDLIKTLAAYNAGPERVALYRGVPPYSETLKYIARILSDFSDRKLAKQNQGQTARGVQHPAASSQRQSIREGAPGADY